MWCQAGLEPDNFWHQTPLHFQVIMRGIRKRLEQQAESDLANSWTTAALTGATQSKGGLKPLKHYLRKPGRRMSNTEMLANMRMLADRANRAAKDQEA